MNERDIEDLVKLALAEYAKQNDLPLDVKTIAEKGYGTDDAGLIVTVGVEEFHLSINQTVFEEV